MVSIISRKIVLTCITLMIQQGLMSQMLPADLQAAVDIENSVPSEIRLSTMMNLRASQELVLAELYEQHESLKKAIRDFEKRKKLHRIVGWMSIPLGAVAEGFATYYLADALSAHQLYVDSTITSDIQSYRQRVELGHTAASILGGVGFGLAGFGVIMLLTVPDREKLEIKYRDVGERILHLEKKLR